MCRSYYNNGQLLPISVKLEQDFLSHASHMGTSGLRGTSSRLPSLVKGWSVFVRQISLCAEIKTWVGVWVEALSQEEILANFIRKVLDWI